MRTIKDEQANVRQRISESFTARKGIPQKEAREERLHHG